MKKFLKDSKMQWEEICYMGDDLSDISVMKKVAFAIAPQDASTEVKKIAHYICQKKGGDGAFREAVELLLKEQKKWGKVLENFTK